MRRPTKSRAAAEAGLSLVELLVAVTILAIATTTALVLYDGARRSFKDGENVAEQQQAVRIAFDLLTSDLRMAGFNTNPDGDKNRRDEQLEGAFPTALVLRADFDFGDPVESTIPETTLAGGAFATVSTGNDEIRAYVLAKEGPGGRVGADTLRFWADVAAVRNGNATAIDLTGVSLTHDDPPYTLYRFSVDAAGQPVATPLVENIRSMRFRYYDRRGFEIGAVGGFENTAARDDRARIRRIYLEIEALTRSPNPSYRDPSDANPSTRAYRKYRLAGDVTPRNLGLAGFRAFLSGVFHPTRPARPTLHVGHCGGIYVTWDPNPLEEEIRSYWIRYAGTSPPTPQQTRTSRATQYFLSGLLDATEYSVRIQAVNDAGEYSSSSPPASITTDDQNTPRAPTSPAASSGRNGEVLVNWTRVVANTTGTAWDPLSPRIRDLAGYRLYRDEDSGFVVDAGSRVADESQIPAVSYPSFLDRNVVNCRTYRYRVSAVDLCNHESAATAEVTGSATSDVQPAPPGSVQAFFNSPTQVRVVWDPVVSDVDGDPIRIEAYRVYWSDVVANGPPPPPPPDPEDFAWIGDTEDGVTEFVHDLSGPVPTNSAVWFSVVAVDECPNESDLPEPANPNCYFSGSPVFEEPVIHSTVSGTTELRVAIVAGTATYDEARFTLINSDGETVHTVTGPGPTWSYTWNAQPLPSENPTRYTIRAEVDQYNGPGSICTAETSMTVDVVP